MTIVVWLVAWAVASVVAGLVVGPFLGGVSSEGQRRPFDPRQSADHDPFDQEGGW